MIVMVELLSSLVNYRRRYIWGGYCFGVFEITVGEGEGGLDWESSIDIYVQNRSLEGSCSVAQEAQLGALRWPGVRWELGLGWEWAHQGRDVCLHRADSLWCTAKTSKHNTVKQLHSNYKNKNVIKFFFLLNKIKCRERPSVLACGLESQHEVAREWGRPWPPTDARQLHLRTWC